MDYHNDANNYYYGGRHKGKSEAFRVWQDGLRTKDEVQNKTKSGFYLKWSTLLVICLKCRVYNTSFYDAKKQICYDCYHEANNNKDNNV